MSNIVGSYTNTSLDSTLQIAWANDSNGEFKGTLSVGAIQFPLSGIWNASTVAPNGILSFTGSTQTPSSMQAAGAAQTDDFNVFSSISLGFTVVQKDMPAMSVCGRFKRS
jgi:hypothetical protein